MKDKRKEVVRQLELLKGDDETEMIRNYKEDLRKLIRLFMEHTKRLERR